VEHAAGSPRLVVPLAEMSNRKFPSCTFIHSLVRTFLFEAAPKIRVFLNLWAGQALGRYLFALFATRRLTALAFKTTRLAAPFPMPACLFCQTRRWRSMGHGNSAREIRPKSLAARYRSGRRLTLTIPAGKTTPLTQSILQSPRRRRFRPVHYRVGRVMDIRLHRPSGLPLPTSSPQTLARPTAAHV
jgi:hypothetical protein